VREAVVPAKGARAVRARERQKVALPALGAVLADVEHHAAGGARGSKPQGEEEPLPARPPLRCVGEGDTHRRSRGLLVLVRSLVPRGRADCSFACEGAWGTEWRSVVHKGGGEQTEEGKDKRLASLPFDPRAHNTTQHVRSSHHLQSTHTQPSYLPLVHIGTETSTGERARGLVVSRSPSFCSAIPTPPPSSAAAARRRPRTSRKPHYPL